MHPIRRLMYPIKKTCNCGNYQPKSIKGVINYDCRNCGGEKKIRKIQ